MGNSFLAQLWGGFGFFEKGGGERADRMERDGPLPAKRKGKGNWGFGWSWGEDPPSFDQIPYFTILAFSPLFFPFLFFLIFFGFGKGTNGRSESRWDLLAVKVKRKVG